MSFTPGSGVLVEILWHANPFRGDKLEKIWTPAAEAALDYGASFWSFLRSQEGGQDFRQQAVFPAKADFDRYWYSEEIAPVALRYGATEQRVYRSQDDTYKFLQIATFALKVDFERYWYGEEFNAWRADFSSWYQVPIVYSWSDLVMHGGLETVAE